MRVEHLRSPNRRPGRRGVVPEAIVLHTTDGTFESAAAWLTDPASGVSAHYLVSLDGRAVQLVDEVDTALHAGRVDAPTTMFEGRDPNEATVGIEFVDDAHPESVTRGTAQYRAGAALLRSVADRWQIPLDRAHVIGHREIFSKKTCPGNLDIDRLLREAQATDPPTIDRRPRPPRLVVLLPARNAAQELDGWFDSVRCFADAVVALDDGSTDDTGARLRAEPLVATLLCNPRRDSYAGWDDAANRQRLLDAAADLDPDWILFLDADERIDAADAQALRTLLAREGRAGVAYGLSHYRMWGDACDPTPCWVYRLFAHRPGQRLPDTRLHFDPVPVDLPPRTFVRTTVRIQHYGAATEERRRERLTKYAEADPDRRWRTDFGGLHAPPTRTVAWKPRQHHEPLLVTPTPEPTAPPSDHNRLVVLLPARNAGADLPEWFRAVRPFADAVVALDDGSTDDTGARLRAEPLVTTVLQNPRRPSYAGWDDAANRQRLLDAAADLDPDWILFLDADERLDTADAAALRAFLDTDALPGLAYGLRVHRMIGDDHFDHADLLVYRLFAYSRGAALPADRLHLVPVPVSIPRSRWVPTTLRIQHFGSADHDRRQARFRKYEEADPARTFQARYTHLLEGPRDDDLQVWEPRPSGGAVIAGTERRLPTLDLDAPVLSAIVISRDDEQRIERVVRSVTEQQCPVEFEVIVVVSGQDATAQIVRDRFPSVRLVELPGAVLPGAARNAGLRVARGDIVSFPGSHVELPPGSLAARIRAHDAGWEMVTGTTRNGTDTASGWAAYFLDHSSVLPGRPSQELHEPPAHCSYLRHLLDLVGGFPEHLRAGEDTVVNSALFSMGYRAFRARDVELVHHNRCETPMQLAGHHFERGRSWGRILRERHVDRAAAWRAEWRQLLGYGLRRANSIDRNTRMWGDGLGGRYQRARPLILLGIAASWAGTVGELAVGGQPRPVSASTPPVVAPVPTPVVFVHVPKTAGAALARVILREHGADAVWRVYGDQDESISRFLALPDEERARVTAVVGHMEFGFDRLLDSPARYVTMLREPVDRIVSHYHYVLERSTGPQPDGVDDLESYVTRSPFAPLFNNGQVRLLGGDLRSPGELATPEMLGRAKHNLETRFAAIGLQDRFDESLLVMARVLGWSSAMPIRINTTAHRPAVEDLSPRTTALISEQNALDVELYEFARELFDRQIAAYGPSFAHDLVVVRSSSPDSMGSAGPARAHSAVSS